MSRDYTSTERALAAEGVEPGEGRDTMPEAVAAVERRLGFSLPPSYVWFLQNYSGAGLFGDEVYSFYGSVIDGHYEFNVDQDVGDVVRQRELYAAEGTIDDKALPLMATDFGELFCLDSSRADANGEYPVVVVRGSRVEDHASDFCAFVERYLREGSP